MKTAKVVSGRDVPASESYDPWLTDPAQRARAEELLRRYPDTTDAETGEIGKFLTKGRQLDVGMVSGSDEFREKVAAFREEHSRHFRLNPRQVIGSIVIAAALLAALLWFAF
jgi:hypothetical protein